MKPHANIPKTAKDFRFLAALGSVNPGDWRSVARDCDIPEEKAEALLRSAATKAFFAWYRALPGKVRQDCAAGYAIRDAWEI